MLRTDDLDFRYPDELVATSALQRGKSRVLRISRDSENFEEINWLRLMGLFSSGDTLVLNDSQVLWARLEVKKKSGTKGEIFFLKAQGNVWEVLAKGLKMKAGGIIDLPGDLKAKVIKVDRISTVEIQSSINLKDYFEKWGQVPLPPYITTLRKNSSEAEALSDRERYQTVWAKQWGSVAAPTAGLHFAQEHLDALKAKGVKIKFVTLHVGAGTFLPIQSEMLSEFKIHSEVAQVPKETCDSILVTQAAGKKVWACGTTALRALETAVQASPTGSARMPLISPFLGETRLFITPGYRFLVVDGLLTNFHQPQSSLLALAAAFATRLPAIDKTDAKKAVGKILKAYEFAIAKKFRLFSYGDLTVMS